jgi:hypothetical protein
MARAVLLMALLACFGMAQGDDAVELALRAALDRQRQSDAFALRLEQSQRELRADTPGERVRLEDLHFSQRDRLKVLHDSDDRRALLLRFKDEVPRWGPSLDIPPHHTPTLERPRPPWTPTLP